MSNATVIGSAQTVPMSFTAQTKVWTLLFAHPPGRRPRKVICGANEISWPPARGLGMIFLAPVSVFNVLIRLLTVGCN